MTAPPPYQPPPKKGRAHVWVLVTGAVIALVSLLLCAGGGFSTVSGAMELVDQPMHEGSHTVHLDEGGTTNVYSESPMATCTATGPDGPVSDSGIANETISLGDRELHRAMKIEADATGDYTIECSAPFVVGQGLSVAGIVVAAVGGLLCVLGSIVVIVGVILWAVRRR